MKNSNWTFYSIQMENSGLPLLNYGLENLKNPQCLIGLNKMNFYVSMAMIFNYSILSSSSYLFSGYYHFNSKNQFINYLNFFFDISCLNIFQILFLILIIIFNFLYKSDYDLFSILSLFFNNFALNWIQNL